MRTLIVGDIHGCFDSLEEVLSKAKYSPERDRLICLGDYIDGFKDAIKVIDFLIDVQQKSKGKNIYLMGNHDKWFYDIISHDIENFENSNVINFKYRHWLSQGGQSTYEAYLEKGFKTIEHHRINFFSKLSLYFEENNNLYVHAGFDPYLGFKKTLEKSPDDLLWDRSLFSKALYYWDLENKSGINSRTFDSYDKIFIGHTPTPVYNIYFPTQICNLINLDQGCKISGRLSVWDLNEGTFYQSNERNKS